MVFLSILGALEMHPYCRGNFFMSHQCLVFGRTYGISYAQGLRFITFCMSGNKIGKFNRNLTAKGRGISAVGVDFDPPQHEEVATGPQCTMQLSFSKNGN